MLPGGPDNRRYFGLSAAFQPHTPVAAILDVVSQTGRHAVLFGERGVGKTSIARVLFDFLAPAEGDETDPVLPYTVCDSADNYSTVWSKVFRQIELVENRPQLGFLSAVDSNVINLASRHAGEFSPDDVVRLLQFLAATSAPVVVTVDEFDRLMDPQATTLFADTIKGLSDASVDVTLLLVGVADSVNELIREHQSAERACAQIRVPRMSPQELQEILVQGFRSVEMMIAGNALASIVSLSQGLPHYTHLLGLTAGREALKLGRLKVTRSDVISAIEAALAGVNESISSAYHDATMSSRTTIYPQVLLACALAELDERGPFAASDVRAPMSSIMGTRYDVPGFAKNLHDLCQEHRGPILHRIGVAKRYRYRFINPLMQPFVIMHGLHNGLITEEGLISQGGLKTEV